MEHVRLRTADGRNLDADLVTVERSERAVVLCHPHPVYGGNRFERVIAALFEALPGHGVSTIRFDFRTDDGGGVVERLDATAAIDAVADAVPGADIHLVGYSFGAHVALSVDDDRVRSRVGIAPVLDIMPIDPPPAVPTLVIVPQHDQFCPPVVAQPVVATWPDARFEIVEMTDHFLGGRIDAAVDQVVTWVVDRPLWRRNT